MQGFRQEEQMDSFQWSVIKVGHTTDAHAMGAASTMRAGLRAQKMLSEMRTELALSKEQRAMAESSAGTRSTQVWVDYMVETSLWWGHGCMESRRRWQRALQGCAASI
eukprot:scaffold17595_cov17-Tisochrysis_lutea.AAC.1